MEYETLAVEKAGETIVVRLDRPEKLNAINDRLQTQSSPFGEITHVASPLELSETPPYWGRPPVPLGTDPPEWPDDSGC